MIQFRCPTVKNPSVSFTFEEFHFLVFSPAAFLLIMGILFLGNALDLTFNSQNQLHSRDERI